MRFTNDLVDTAAMRELGERVARQRLARNLKQTDLARAAGVSRSAIQRLEGGETVTLTVLIRSLRALGLAENLEALLPPPEPQPLELLEHHGRARRRARPAEADADREPDQPWRWGATDEDR